MIMMITYSHDWQLRRLKQWIIYQIGYAQSQLNNTTIKM
jgi:hypothetical protein